MSFSYQLIVPMTGIGQRFVDAGFKALKPLIDTGQGSMISNVLNNFALNDSPICIINESEPQKMELRQEIARIRPKAKILEILPHKKGPSYAVWCIREFLNLELPTVVSYCDFSGIWSEQEFLQELSKCEGLIQTYKGFHPHMLRNTKFAYVQKDSQNYVTNIQEKQPFTESPMNEEASSGLYGFQSGKLMLDAIETQLQNNLSLNGEFYTSLTFIPLIRQNLKIRTIQMQKFFQWGTPEDLADFKFWRLVSRHEFKNKGKQRKSCGIVLAAGQGSRISKLTGVPKPFLPVFNKKLWHFSANLLRDCKERIIFSTLDYKPEIEADNLFEFQVVTAEFSTSSQTESAYEALKCLKEDFLKVHITACDNIIIGDFIHYLDEALDSTDLIVWVTSNYTIANKNSDQYSWVETNSDGKVIKLLVKEMAPTQDSKVVIGNFSFKSIKLAKSLIEATLELNSDLQAEIYLEWVVKVAIENNLHVKAIEIDKFWALGTPDEYYTVKYWKEALTPSRVVM